jgi:hypothetical protein
MHSEKTVNEVKGRVLFSLMKGINSIRDKINIGIVSPKRLEEYSAWLNEIRPTVSAWEDTKAVRLSQKVAHLTLEIRRKFPEITVSL